MKNYLIVEKIGLKTTFIKITPIEKSKHSNTVNEGLVICSWENVVWLHFYRRVNRIGHSRQKDVNNITTINYSTKHQKKITLERIADWFPNMSNIFDKRLRLLRPHSRLSCLQK